METELRDIKRIFVVMILVIVVLLIISNIMIKNAYITGYNNCQDGKGGIKIKSNLYNDNFLIEVVPDDLLNQFINTSVKISK